MTWREINADQNLRIANKMLEQQGEINDLKAQLAKVKQERAEVRQARDGANGKGELLWQHTCGHIEAFCHGALADIKGGCDACESSSDNPDDWEPLYVGPVYGRWTQVELDKAEADAEARWAGIDAFIDSSKSRDAVADSPEPGSAGPTVADALHGAVAVAKAAAGSAWKTCLHDESRTCANCQPSTSDTSEATP